MERNIAWIHPDQSKNAKPIPVPLNQEALEVLVAEKGKHITRVFTYKGNPIRRANSSAWRKALDRAGIAPYIPPDCISSKYKNKTYPTKEQSKYKYKRFRWHDLRHTWASWHVQAGTPLPVLQKLGGWSCYEMVLRYAHLAPDHTAVYAENSNFGLNNIGSNVTSIFAR